MFYITFYIGYKRTCFIAFFSCAALCAGITEMYSCFKQMSDARMSKSFKLQQDLYGFSSNFMCILVN